MANITILYKTEDQNEELWFEHFQSTLKEECPEFDFVSHEIINDNQVTIAKAVNSSRRVCLLDTPSLQGALMDCQDWLASYLCNDVCIVSVCDDNDTEGIILDEDDYEHCSKWKRFALSADGEANLKAYKAISDFLKETVAPKPTARKPEKRPRRKPNSNSNEPKLPSAIDGKIECVCPITIYRDGSDKQVLIVFKTPMSADIKIEIADIEEVKFTKRNPYVVEFTAPDRKPGKALIKVYEAGKLLPDKWSLRYAEPNLAPFQCISSLMRSLDIKENNMQELDKKLANIFIESCPRDQLLQRLYDNNNCPTDPVSKYAFPTLLHFAAHHGLEELVATFINSPLGMQGCNIKNHRRHDPAEMAEHNGNPSIAEYIRDEMAIAHVMDDYVHFQISRQGSAAGGDEPYDDVSKFTGRHLVFEGKGYTKMYSQANTNRRVQIETDTTTSTPGYLRMVGNGDQTPSHANVKRSQSDRLPDRPVSPLPNAGSRSAATLGRPECPIPNAGNRPAVALPPDLTANNLFETKGTPAQNPVMGSVAAGELAEIGEFAKNEDYSTDEVIMLFQLWNKQYATGSPSFKQRQEALAEMRRDIMKKEAEQKVKKKGFKSIFGKKNQYPKPPNIEISDPIHYREAEILQSEDRDSCTSTGSSDRSSRGSKTDSSDTFSDDCPRERAPQLPPRPKASTADLYAKVNKNVSKRLPPPPPKSLRNKGPPIPPR